MNRRNFVASTAAASLGLVNHAIADDHSHHAKPFKVPNTLSKKQQQDLISSTEECISTAKACLNHCAREFAKGNTSMAECNLILQNMLVSTEAMNRIAHLNSLDKGALKQTAMACAQICKECKKACDKHAKMHEECKNCSEACKSCIKACEAIS